LELLREALPRWQAPLQPYQWGRPYRVPTIKTNEEQMNKYRIYTRGFLQSNLTMYTDWSDIESTKKHLEALFSDTPLSTAEIRVVDSDDFTNLLWQNGALIFPEQKCMV
jgi:hypothetical protein